MIGALELVLVRHGQTEANRKDLMQGHCDYPLTIQGTCDCKLTGIALAQVPWARVVCSDLPRAVKTCCYILEQKDMSYEEALTALGATHKDPLPLEEVEKLPSNQSSSIYLTKDARELYKGIREGLPKDMDIDEVRAVVAQRTGQDIKTIVDNAENQAHLYERQKKMLLDIVQALSHTNTAEAAAINTTETDNTNNLQQHVGNVLCVAHGGFIKQFLYLMCKMSLPTIEKIKNCSITTVHVEWDDNYNIICTHSIDRISLVHHLPLRRTEDDVTDVEAAVTKATAAQNAYHYLL